MTTTSKTKVAIVDDHRLFRKGVLELINSFNNFEVVWEAENGLEVQGKMQISIPDIALMDINMKGMNGEETTRWLQSNFPTVRVLALSMYDDESAIIKMIKSGVRGYILKDTDPAELRVAMETVLSKGYYYSELVSKSLVNNVVGHNINSTPVLNDREVEFLKLACSELTYKEIADEMHVAVRTVDGYRDTLFEKLGCKSRVGLVLFAVKHSIVTP